MSQGLEIQCAPFELWGCDLANATVLASPVTAIELLYANRLWHCPVEVSRGS